MAGIGSRVATLVAVQAIRSRRIGVALTVVSFGNRPPVLAWAGGESMALVGEQVLRKVWRQGFRFGGWRSSARRPFARRRKEEQQKPSAAQHLQACARQAKCTRVTVGRVEMRNSVRKRRSSSGA